MPRAGKQSVAKPRKAVKASKANVPVVRTFEIKKTLFGSYRASYKCPHCSLELKSNETDLRDNDSCPKCAQAFRVSSDAVTEIEADREQVRAEKEKKRLEKQRLGSVRSRARTDAKKMSRKNQGAVGGRLHLQDEDEEEAVEIADFHGFPSQKGSMANGKLVASS